MTRSSIEEAMQALARQDGRSEVPPHVEAAVMRAFDARKVDERRFGWRHLSASMAWRLSASAAAAATILVVVLMSIDRSTPQRPNGTPVPRPTIGAAEPNVGFVLVNDPMLPSTAVTVMRVRMPRNTLANLGVPLIDPEGTGEVAVDVLVGEDGIARSIRPVRAATDGER